MEEFYSYTEKTLQKRHKMGKILQHKNKMYIYKYIYIVRIAPFFIIIVIIVIQFFFNIVTGSQKNTQKKTTTKTNVPRIQLQGIKASASRKDHILASTRGAEFTLCGYL